MSSKTTLRFIFGPIVVCILLFAGCQKPAPPQPSSTTETKALDTVLKSPAITLSGENGKSAATPPITVTNSLSISLTYDWANDDPAGCSADPKEKYQTLLMSDPAGNQTEAGVITGADLFGGSNCQGHSNKTKTVTPLTAKGTYVFVMLGRAMLSLDPFTHGRATSHPAIRFVADGKTVVDRTYPVPQSMSVQQYVDIFTVIYK